MKTNNSVDQEALCLELPMKQVVSNYFAAAKTHTDHAPITTQTGNATHLVAPMLNTATLVQTLQNKS